MQRSAWKRIFVNCTSEFLPFGMVKLLKEKGIWKTFGVNLALAVYMIFKLPEKLGLFNTVFKIPFIFNG